MNYSNTKTDSTIKFAVDLYLNGSALRHLELDVADCYYIACGNFRIVKFLYENGLRCSPQHQYRYFMWRFFCYICSLMYETQRIPSVRGQFGFHPFTAYIGSCTLYLILVIMLGSLNYIIMGRVMKKCNAGPIVYHRVEILCGIIMAVMNLNPEQTIGIIVGLGKNLFTGIFTVFLSVACYFDYSF